jgi:hypothetical protein
LQVPHSYIDEETALEKILEEDKIILQFGVKKCVHPNCGIVILCILDKDPVSEQYNELEGTGNQGRTYLIPEKTKESFNHFPG